VKEYDVELVTGFKLQQKMIEAMNRRAKDGWRVVVVTVNEAAAAWITLERDATVRQ
jgi:hypothetical protein